VTTSELFLVCVLYPGDPPTHLPLPLGTDAGVLYA